MADLDVGDYDTVERVFSPPPANPPPPSESTSPSAGGSSSSGAAEAVGLSTSERLCSPGSCVQLEARLLDPKLLALLLEAGFISSVH